MVFFLYTHTPVQPNHCGEGVMVHEASWRMSFYSQDVSTQVCLHSWLLGREVVGVRGPLLGCLDSDGLGLLMRLCKLETAGKQLRGSHEMNSWLRPVGSQRSRVRLTARVPC